MKALRVIQSPKRRCLEILLLAAVAAIVAACSAVSPDPTALPAPLQVPDTTVSPAPTSAPQQPETNKLDANVDPPDPLKREEPNVAAAFSRPDGEKERVLEIHTILPKDGIPSIDNPSFLNASEASEQMGGQDLVIGLSINGEHKAYSTAFLSSHEIVNDTVGGMPVAVTW